MLSHLGSLLFSPLLPMVFFIVFLIKWFYYSSKLPNNLLPSPTKLPIIGNLYQLGSLPHRSLQSMSQKYGPLIQLHFGSKPIIVVSSANEASEIMKNHDIVFSDRPMSLGQKLFYNSKDVAFAPYGEYWRQMRSICVLQLLSNHRVHSFQSLREEETCLMIEKIKQRCSPCSSALINLTDILITLTNDMICRVAFGRKYGDEEHGKKAKNLLGDFVQLLGVFDVGVYIPWLGWINRLTGLNSRVEKIVKAIDEFTEGVIEEHEKKAAIHDNGPERTDSDFVDILLRIQRENSCGFAIERDSLKALILEMFTGGTDTTFTALEWAMAELLKHPKILANLQTEVREAAQGKPEITEDDLHKMHYLKAVIKETLRLHPPLPLLVPRQSTGPAKVMGYDIPAATQVIVNAWTIQRDPQVWENPDEFQPERFLNSDIDIRGLNFGLIPFGAGRRGCPGISFAMAIIELALAKLVHKFDFALPAGTLTDDLDMSEVSGIVVHKKFPLLAVATLRTD